MSLQPRTTAPGKARRAASVGKPKRTKKAAEFKAVDPKARHTTAQKNARKGAAALDKSAVGKSGKATTTRRYSDSDSSTVSKKEVRLTDRSKLRAQRFQEKTSSRPRPLEAPEERKARIELSQKPESRAKKFVAERTERDKRPVDKKPDFKKTEYKKKEYVKPENKKPEYETTDFKKPTFKKTDYKKSDTRPTNRRDAAIAKASRNDDGRPNFIPRKVEKLIQLVQRSVLRLQIHVLQIFAQSVQFVIAAMILRHMPVMISSIHLRRTPMPRSILEQMITTFRQI